MYVWLGDIHGAPDRGGPGVQPFHGCGVTPVVPVFIKAVVCWPVPEDAGNVDYAIFDQPARFLTQAAEVGLDSLRDLVCSTKGTALWRWGVRDWWVHEVTPSPRQPRGGCAGVTWRMSVAPNGQWPPGPVLPAPPA